MNREVLKGLSHDELVEKCIGLETELIEFQDSSRDLETMLESELQAMEQSHGQLKVQVEEGQTKIKQLESKCKDLESVVGELRDKSIANEISTDEHQLQERILKQDVSKYQDLNNTYLEKIAMMDNDHELEKQQQQAENDRLQTRVRELEKEIVKAKRRSYYFNTTLSTVSDGFEEDEEDQENQTMVTKHDDTTDEVGNISVISIREALRSGPPLSKSISNLNLHLHNDSTKRRRSLLSHKPTTTAPP